MYFVAWVNVVVEFNDELHFINDLIFFINHVFIYHVFSLC